MTEDEMKKFLSENSAEINRAVKEKLIANLLQEHRWQATDQIAKAVGEFITTDVLPEVRVFLQGEKGAIVAAAQEAARQIGNTLAETMAKKAAEMTTKITAIIPLPGLHFGADFYVRATIAVESFGSPETGRGYLADPAGYDPGAGPEWSITGTPELYLDSGGDGERVLIGPEFAEALKAFIERDSAASDAAEREIADHAKGGVVP